MSNLMLVSVSNIVNIRIYQLSSRPITCVRRRHAPQVVESASGTLDCFHDARYPSYRCHMAPRSTDPVARSYNSGPCYCAAGES